MGSIGDGDDDEAERLLDEATSLLRHVGPWYLSLALYVRAILALRRDKPDEAIAVVRESLTQIRQLDDKFAFVGALRLLAVAAALKGDDAWAARILGARDRVIEHTGTSLSTHRCTISRNERSGTREHALARIGGPERMQRDEALRSIRC